MGLVLEHVITHAHTCEAGEASVRFRGFGLIEPQRKAALNHALSC